MSLDTSCIKQTLQFTPSRTETRAGNDLEYQLCLGPYFPVKKVDLVFSVGGRRDAKAPASISSAPPRMGYGSPPLLFSECLIALIHCLQTFAGSEQLGNREDEALTLTSFSNASPAGTEVSLGMAWEGLRVGRGSQPISAPLHLSEGFSFS